VADAGLHVADGLGQLEGLVGALLEQVKGDALGRAHADAGEAGELGHQVLDALGVSVHSPRL
jgi:hypothetical protein